MSRQKSQSKPIDPRRFTIGDHLVTPRTGYTHHGLYAGQGKVIHYSGLAAGLSAGPVEETTLRDFASGHKVMIRKHPSRKHDGRTSVFRARKRIGETAYRVESNNCEHFVNWCINGKHKSPQVDRGSVGAGAGMGSAAGAGALAVTSASGAVVGTSGAGVMSGLASVGGAVGGGAIAGVGVMAGSAGVAAAMLVNKTVLRDDESMPQNERDARQVGRTASVIGAAGATAGGIGAIAASGSVAGLSAAGITSGLAAVGGTVGGGMAAGVALTAAAPVAAAVAGGLAIYKFAQWWSE